MLLLFSAPPLLVQLLQPDPVGDDDSDVHLHLPLPEALSAAVAGCVDRPLSRLDQLHHVFTKVRSKVIQKINTLIYSPLAPDLVKLFRVLSMYMYMCLKIFT